MSRLAVQIAELARDHLDPALFGAGDADRMVAAAARLAPAPGLGFEFRLGSAGGPVDLSQRFRIADDALALLRWASAEHGRHPDPAVAAVWRRVGDFVDLWAKDPDAIRELWLEIDADGPPSPSVFVYFRDPLPGNAAARRLLEALAGDVGPAWTAAGVALEGAATLGMEAGRVAALMLSRTGALRVMIRGAAQPATIPFLAALGWQGPADELAAILAEPRVVASDPQLVLDFAPDLLPLAGLEMLGGHDDGGRRRLRGVLDWMVETGLADPARAAAVTAWTGAFGPLQAGAGWPDAMIVRGLLDDAPPAAWQRITNHVKLNLMPGARPVAKAYLALLEGAVS